MRDMIRELDRPSGQAGGTTGTPLDAPWPLYHLLWTTPHPMPPNTAARRRPRWNHCCQGGVG